VTTSAEKEVDQALLNVPRDIGVSPARYGMGCRVWASGCAADRSPFNQNGLKVGVLETVEFGGAGQGAAMKGMCNGYFRAGQTSSRHSPPISPGTVASTRPGAERWKPGSGSGGTLARSTSPSSPGGGRCARRHARVSAARRRSNKLLKAARGRGVMGLSGPP